MMSRRGAYCCCSFAWRLHGGYCMHGGRTAVACRASCCLHCHMMAPNGHRSSTSAAALHLMFPCPCVLHPLTCCSPQQRRQPRPPRRRQPWCAAAGRPVRVFCVVLSKIRVSCVVRQGVAASVQQGGPRTPCANCKKGAAETSCCSSAQRAAAARAHSTARLCRRRARRRQPQYLLPLQRMQRCPSVSDWTRACPSSHRRHASGRRVRLRTAPKLHRLQPLAVLCALCCLLCCLAHLSSRSRHAKRSKGGGCNGRIYRLLQAMQTWDARARRQKKKKSPLKKTCCQAQASACC